MLRINSRVILVVTLLAASLLPVNALQADAPPVEAPAQPAHQIGDFIVYLPLQFVPPFMADFDASPTSGSVPLTVQFTNQSIGAFTHSLWDFGDATTSTQTHPVHIYAAAGPFTVSLTVSNTNSSDTLIQTDLINVSSLQANFTASPSSGPVPLPVQFTNQSSGDFTHSLWDFGDGSTSTETNPSHSYSTAGVFTVSLTVSNAYGSDTLTQSNLINSFAASGYVQNGSFEDENWVDLPPAPGNLINQQPNSWALTWVEPGQPIFGSTDLAGGVPECVHKLADQLPPDEQPGGINALILDGVVTYKMFHAFAPFGAELVQTVTGLPPGSNAQLIVPIQLHLQSPESDPYGAESGVWVNGIGNWANLAVMGDRTWYHHTVNFVVPGNGEATIIIRVKTKWSGKDFFVDNIQLNLTRDSESGLPPGLRELSLD